MIGLGFALLIALGAVAERWTVTFRREGLTVAFSLPYVAGAVVLAGPWAGLLVELLALALGARRGAYFGSNLAVAAVANLAAGAAWWICGAATWPLLGGVGLYVAVHVGANAALVGWWNHRRRVHSGVMQRVAGARSVVSLAVAYFGLAALVAGLVYERQFLWLPATIAPVYVLRDVLDAVRRMDDQAYETLVALMVMMQRAHPYTHGHLGRVARLAEVTARKLGLRGSRARRVREAAILHDIGKIAIDERILDKPGRLTEDEYAHVKQHSAFGAEILRHADRFGDLVPWVRHHHERPDGRGYPDGLREIPLESKIIAVADAFDAMVGSPEASGQRAHRAPMTSTAALDELRRCAGQQFDTSVVMAFDESVREVSP